MGYLRKRLDEKSTYTGLAVIASLLTGYVGPEAMQDAGIVVAAIAAIVQVFTPEKGGR